jgi:hypothetical protein
MYSVSFTGVAVSAAVDCFELVAATGKPIVLHEVVIGQSTDEGDAESEMLQVLIKRGIGNDSGSGGSTATPAKHLGGDEASGITAETNNTTQAAAGSGSLTTLRSECWNVQAGYQYLPMPKHRYVFRPGEALVVSISAPADEITVSATLVFEEHNGVAALGF